MLFISGHLISKKKTCSRHITEVTKVANNQVGDHCDILGIVNYETGLERRRWIQLPRITEDFDL